MTDRPAKKELSRKEFLNRLSAARARPEQAGDGKIRKLLRRAGVTETSQEYRDHMKRNPEMGWSGFKRGLKREGIGAATGAAVGAGIGTAASALGGKGNFRNTASWVVPTAALYGGAGGAVAGTAVNLAKAGIKTDELEKTFAESKGLSKERTPRTGLAGKLGLKKTKYYSAPGKKASFDLLALDFIPVRATSKTAVVDDTLHETEEDARKRRLGEMLRRRQHSGLDTGSTTPNPPRDNS